jgi:hypothetical protein
LFLQGFYLQLHLSEEVPDGSSTVVALIDNSNRTVAAAAISGPNAGELLSDIQQRAQEGSTSNERTITRTHRRLAPTIQNSFSDILDARPNERFNG